MIKPSEPLMGVSFLKARTGVSRHLAKKTRMLPFLGEPILLIRNSFILVLSDHFWGVNFDFCANFINQNSFCDIRENIPNHRQSSRHFCIQYAWELNLNTLQCDNIVSQRSSGSRPANRSFCFKFLTNRIQCIEEQKRGW